MAVNTDSYVLIKSALDRIYQHCFENRLEIELSRTCYCLACNSTIPSSEIVNWVTNTVRSDTARRGLRPSDASATCPRCGNTSVIGDACGYSLTPALLDALHEFRFERATLPDDFDYSWFEPPR